MYEWINWDASLGPIFLLNLAIAIAIFTSIRLFSGVISNVSASKELLTKDNPAFGISMAGVTFAVTIVLSGAIYSDPVFNMVDSVLSVLLYGVVGLALMALARIIFDKMALPGLSIEDEIVKGNVAAGIVDAGNVIATALIIRTVMIWVESNSLQGIQSVLIAFVISQVLLTLMMHLRLRRLVKKTNGTRMEDALRQGNKAIALRFAGRRIELAFAIVAASNVMITDFSDTYTMMVNWTALSVIMIVLISVLSFLADSLILYKVDADKEVIQQSNVALGAFQGAIYISIGLLVSELLI